MRPLMLALLTTASLACLARGQDTVPVQATEAEKKFDAAVRSVEKLLKGTKAYSVAVVCNWSATGNGPDRSGKNRLSLVVAGPDKVRLEAYSDGQEADTSLVVVGDGKAITRVYPARKIYNRTPTARALDDLQTDAVTRQALRGCGIDFLLRTDMVGTILAQTTTVTDLGVVAAGDRKLQAYRLGLADGRVVEVRLTPDRHLPVEIHTTVRIPVADKQTFELRLAAQLTWDLEAKPAAGTFAAELPEGARAVADLMSALLDGEVTTFLGKPVPALTFADLDGGKVAATDLKGKVAVLYFWATWATPSTRDVAGVNQFIETYAARGVTFLRVAVGEKADDVKEFVAKEGFKGRVVLDPQAQALAALKANALPAVVLLGADGTVQAYYRGGTPGLHNQVRQDLDRLLKGEKLH